MNIVILVPCELKAMIKVNCPLIHPNTSISPVRVCARGGVTPVFQETKCEQI